MADEYIFSQSLESDGVMNTPFIKRETLQISDMQGGSYNGKLTFDTSRLATSGRWVDLKSAEIQIPFTIVSKSSVDISSAANAYMCGLKAGTHHLIDSMSVRLNNRQILQETPFLNHFVQWKLLSSWSQDDVKKNGASIFFSPDTATSFNLSADGSSKDGQGVSNNRAAPTALVNMSTVGVKGATHNAGFTERLRNVTDISTGGAAAATNLGGLGGNLSASQAVTAKKSYFTDDAGSGAARVYVWHILARIRLKDLSDLFENIPLIRSPFLQINLTYNTSSQTITYTHSGTTVVSGTPTIVGNTNPIMIASGIANNPNATTFSTANRTQIFSCGIYTATDGTNSRTNTLASSCQLICDAYTMLPSAEKQYLSTVPSKTVRYSDLHYQLLQSVTGSFQSLVTGGLKRAKRLVIIPYYNKASNTGLTTVPIYQSPFTSEPGTTSVYPSISNFQIQVSGVNLWPSAVNYDYEMFKSEVSTAYAMSGGLQLGMSTGLISEQDWAIGYRYIVADLSRRFPADEDVARSIQISGTVNNAATLDLLVFIEYERAVQIDTATSAIISTDI